MNVSHKPFQRVTVVDIKVLDKQHLLDHLSRAYASDNGVEQDYVEWNTGWDYSESAKAVSKHLVENGGLPSGMDILLKINGE